MFAKGSTIIQWMEQLAPKWLAIADDRIGLQLGSLNKEVTHVLVALDVNDEVVEEAIAQQADLIIAHHAIIFKPLTHLQADMPAGKLYEKLIKHNIAVYISHTNYDVATDGMNDLMAARLQLMDVQVMKMLQHGRLYKLITFVPETDADKVRMAIFDAGAGQLGNYSHCSFNLNGTGTYKPKEGSSPYIGQVGTLETVKEVRIETIVSESIRSRVLQAMFSTHPYEEVAYDLYLIDIPGKTYGLGRVGKLSEVISLRQLSEKVKTNFEVSNVRVVGNLDRPIHKVAVLGGSGSRYIHHALSKGADVFVTGDIDYHTAQDALAAGLAIIDPGHNAEKMMKKDVTERLRHIASSNGVLTQFQASTIDTEPFQFL